MTPQTTKRREAFIRPSSLSGVMAWRRLMAVMLVATAQKPKTSLGDDDERDRDRAGCEWNEEPRPAAQGGERDQDVPDSEPACQTVREQGSRERPDIAEREDQSHGRSREMEVAHGEDEQNRPDQTGEEIAGRDEDHQWPHQRVTQDVAQAGDDLGTHPAAGA